MAIHNRGIRETDDMAQKGKRYNADKLVRPSDGEAWTRFDGIHHKKAERGS
jgi:hypothetical protein